MATDITPDPAVALDAASLAALENTTVTVGAALPAGANAIGTVTAVQATAANLKVDASGVAVPVTDNGGSLTVDGAVTVSGTATVSGTVAATQSGTWTVQPGNTANTTAWKVDGSAVTQPVSGTVAVTGVATETTLAAGNVLEGAVTETAPATDTASSGLNGRLQRIAQRLTSLIAVFTIGAGTEAAAVRVTLPTDGTGKVSAAQSGTWTVQPGNTANTTAWKVDGSAVTQPVSGTVTAISGTATNLKVDASGVAVPITDNAGSLTVDYATTGSGTATGALRVELANNSTGIIATVGAVTALTNALPAGTNNIGDVDVLTMPGTGVEDAGETAGGTLLMSGTVRRDTPASSAGTTGDNATLNTDALGHVWVALPAIVRISVTPTVSTTPAYTAKDAVGGLLTFANAVRVSAGSAILQSVTIIDNSQQRPSLELVLFNQTFTASTDNAIFAPSDADLANTLGVVAVNSWSDFSTNSVATVDGIGKTIVLTGTSLFGQLLTRGTPTFVATTDIIVILGIIYN